MEYLRLPEKVAREVVLCLEREGYLESIRDETKITWATTINGNALSMASAAKAVKRETATKKLDELLHRVHVVNESEEFLFKVVKVVVFGSYLSDNDYVNDVDVAVKAEIKEKDPKRFAEVYNARMKEYKQSGRNFRTKMHMCAWPEMDVYKYLKGKSRVISITTMNDGILGQVTFKVYFDAKKDS